MIDIAAIVFCIVLGLVGLVVAVVAKLKGNKLPTQISTIVAKLGWDNLVSLYLGAEAAAAQTDVLRDVITAEIIIAAKNYAGLTISASTAKIIYEIVESVVRSTPLETSKVVAATRQQDYRKRGHHH